MPSVEELAADLASRDESAAEAAVPRLAAHGERAFPALIRLLQSDDADARWWAVRALAAMTAPPVDLLMLALTDGKADVRAAGALALAAHPDEAAVPALVQAVNDEDGLVAVLAVNALVKLGGAAVPLLIEAFDEAAPRGRIQIMRTLAELHDQRGTRLMMASLDKDSAAVQYWARQGLDSLGLNMVYLEPD